MHKHHSTGNVSLSSLLAVLVSVIVAIFILIVFILPAEFGKDITGLGEKFGINNMSLVEAELEEKNEESTSSSNNGESTNLLPANIVDNSDNEDRNEGKEHALFTKPLQFMQTEIVLEADAEAEFKFILETGVQVNYSWSVADGKLAYSDLHGHTQGATPEDELLVKYLDSQQDNALSGQFIAGLTGEHGWYFLNLQDEEIKITINASGHWDKYEFLPIESY